MVFHAVTLVLGTDVTGQSVQGEVLTWLLVLHVSSHLPWGCSTLWASPHLSLMVLLLTERETCRAQVGSPVWRSVLRLLCPVSSACLTERWEEWEQCILGRSVEDFRQNWCVEPRARFHHASSFLPWTCMTGDPWEPVCSKGS